MSLLPSLPIDLQKAVEEVGLPLPLSAEDGEHVYLLLECDTTFHRKRGYTASIQGVSAFGEGDTKEEAALALREALRRFMEVFG